MAKYPNDWIINMEKYTKVELFTVIFSHLDSGLNFSEAIVLNNILHSSLESNFVSQLVSLPYCPVVGEPDLTEALTFATQIKGGQS